MNVETKERILKKVRELKKLYHEGKIPTLKQHEVHPNLSKGSRENYLYFTLAPCLNFQRQSPALWAAAFKTYEDLETKYLFFPEHVQSVSRNKIQTDLLKHKLALQRNKHTDIWIAITSTLYTHFHSDPREILSQGGWKISKILQLIQETYKDNFPYLRGPKMSNYWLYILSSYTDASFLDMSNLSIIPDTHVLQSSVQLGLSRGTESSVQLASIWRDLLKGSDITPVEMHPVLWHWSRNNFQPSV